jgi:hypothetical protein
MAKLDSWNDGPSRRAIEGFVASVSTGGSADYVPPPERVAVFDNDGTLWPEKPMPAELGFVLRRLAAMAEEDPSLRVRQPWRAAYENDYAWVGAVVTKHYHGDDSDAKVLVGGILQAFAGMPVEQYASDAAAFLRSAQHPTLKRRFRDCSYQPMVELLRYLEAHGFANYIVSGGDRDFMRAVTMDIYGVPSERVVGSSSALGYADNGGGSGAVAYLTKMDVFDDGPAKPVRIWSRIGRRPLLSFGNSNGDIQMLQFTGGGARPALRLLLLHDDGQREFEYTAGAERLLEIARERKWTTVSMKDDWKAMFAPQVR